jgi:hypothetical protein
MQLAPIQPSEHNQVAYLLTILNATRSGETLAVDAWKIAETLFAAGYRLAFECERPGIDERQGYVAYRGEERITCWDATDLVEVHQRMELRKTAQARRYPVRCAASGRRLAENEPGKRIWLWCKTCRCEHSVLLEDLLRIPAQ